MKKNLIIFASIFLIFLNGISASPVLLPHAFHGTVNYENGSPVKSGEVLALIDGKIVERGEIINGKFGYNKNFIVEQDHGDYIEIYVSGYEESFEKIWLTSGAVTNLNIILPNPQQTNPKQKNKGYTTVAFEEFCEPIWQCSAWSGCSNDGYKTRQCSDIDSCDYEYNKPAETTGCEMQKVLIKKNENAGYLILGGIFFMDLVMTLGITIVALRKKKVVDGKERSEVKE